MTCVCYITHHTVITHNNIITHLLIKPINHIPSEATPYLQARKHRTRMMQKLRVSFFLLGLLVDSVRSFQPNNFLNKGYTPSRFYSTPALQEDSVAEKTKGSSSSKSFESILQRSSSSDPETSFWEANWQRKPQVLAAKSPSKELSGDGKWNADANIQNPLEEMIQQGWHVLVDLLQQGSNPGNIVADPPLIMKNGQQQPRPMNSDNAGLFVSYLDNASIVQNHADLLSPWIAAVCNDMQQSFPHVYANTYLTPPNSQTVPAHADDRDVFVVQLVGQKQWSVYEEVPIPYPFPHEQVGKDRLSVPPSVVEGAKSIDQTLMPGDVLYIPRGHVHEAKTSGEGLSFHVTLAIATFDWTLGASLLNLASQSILRNEELRKSILPQGNAEDIQNQIETILETLKQQITGDRIIEHLQSKIKLHKQRESPLRVLQLERIQLASIAPQVIVGVGPQAVPYVTWSTHLRVATAQEHQGGIVEPTLVVHAWHEETIDMIRSTLLEEQSIQVSELKLLFQGRESIFLKDDLALLALAKRAVELGELAIVIE